MEMMRALRLRCLVFLLELFDLLTFLVFVTGIVLFVRFFVFNPYTVVGQSMEPEFSQWDFIIVDKVSPRMGRFSRWDVIVFVPEGKDVPYIKRIIGLPWEVVRVKDGKVFVCTKPTSGTWDLTCNELSEPYLATWTLTSTTRCKKDEFEVTWDWYFVMGDNRGHSTDSLCCFGLWCYEWANYLAHPQDMIGKVAVRLFPELKRYW
jgi:signal peptidase I